MERSTAIEILRRLTALDGPINKAIEAVEKIQNVDQRRTFRRTLASVVGTVYTGLVVPIGIEFPDLLPDKQDLDKP
jgi:hypothetical protein